MIPIIIGATGAGCKNGYCWAYCSPFSDIWDWCYTKGGDNRDSKGYARCTGNGGGHGEYVDAATGFVQCSAHWKCKGSCTL